MSAAGGLTVLVCDSDHTASKAYACQPDGSWNLTAITTWDSGSDRYLQECRDLHDFSEVVEIIRETGNAIIVRGELDEAGRAALDADPELRIVRRKNAKPDNIPAHLTEAARAWVLLDIDGWPLPPDSCLCDGCRPRSSLKPSIRCCLSHSIMPSASGSYPVPPASCLEC